MNLLYFGKYKYRFRHIYKYINNTTSILELCFGDVYTASFCKKNNINWIGIDIYKNFVEKAKKMGYNAIEKNINEISVFPKSQLCLIMGSLYHFNYNLSLLLEKILASSNKIIISEPIINLSNKKGIIGFLAKKSANAGNGNENYRYTETTLLDELNKFKDKLSYSFNVLERYNKDIIIEIVNEK